MSAARLRYAVGLDAASTHHVDVMLDVDAVDGPLSLWMPAWAPGSYMIREFARNLRAISAHDEHGRALEVERVDKATVRVHSVSGRVRVRYRVYAFELSVRTSCVEPDRALLNGASVFLAPGGREREPIAVTIDAPSTWRVFTALPRGADGAWTATDYDHLIDTPFVCGAFEERAFDVNGTAHRIVFAGIGPWDVARIADATAAIVAENARMFGFLPYDQYVFHVLTSADGKGGLEHANSTVLLHPRHGFADAPQWNDFVTLVAHEHFHAWNVKHARPRELAALDLRAETYTRSLWIVEGVTSYYDELVPLRARVVTRAVWLERLAEAIMRHRETPGRARETLEDASLLAWVRLYRPDEDTQNSAISYYAKGALVALLLDLAIRERSGGKWSLDDAMAAFARAFPPAGPGYRGDEFERACSEHAGQDLAEFFDVAVRSTAELDLDAPLARFGLSVREQPKEKPTARDLLGTRMKRAAGRAAVESIEPDSPAERAGLSARDEIVAIDGARVDAETLGPRLRQCGLGADVNVTAFRDDLLIERRARLATSLKPTLTVVATPGADAATQARLVAWLGGE